MTAATTHSTPAPDDFTPDDDDTPLGMYWAQSEIEFPAPSTTSPASIAPATPTQED